MKYINIWYHLNMLHSISIQGIWVDDKINPRGKIIVDIHIFFSAWGQKYLLYTTAWNKGQCCQIMKHWDNIIKKSWEGKLCALASFRYFTWNACGTFYHALRQERTFFPPINPLYKILSVMITDMEGLNISFIEMILKSCIVPLIIWYQALC